MAGRGRGRGGSISQISSNLGLNRGDSNINQINSDCPPPLYPPLQATFKNLSLSNDSPELLNIHDELLAIMQQSPFFKTFDELNKKSFDVPRYTDKYKPTVPDIYQYAEEHFDWNYIPMELRPKISSTKKKRKEVNVLDVKKKLETLEVIESKTQEEEGETLLLNKENPDVDKTSDTEKDPNVEEVDTPPGSENEEEENDYADTYFDNGEDFIEEDNDSDEGPVF